MCVACLAFSALTLFTPVSDAPQVIDVSQNGGREITFARMESPSLAHQTQAAIAEFLNYLPTDPELELLRTGMTNLSADLRTATSDAEAQRMIDDHLQTLQEDVFASPNSDRIIAILRQIVLGDSELQVSRIEHLNWGWLG